MSVNELIDQLRNWNPETQISIRTKSFAEYYPVRVENIHGHPVILVTEE